MNTHSTIILDNSTRSDSYGQIVKASSIMGGVAAVSLVFGMLRTKAAAVLIGTTGAGLLANFVAVQSVMTTLSGLGIGSSAVRDVAKAHGREDSQEIGRTVHVLRQVTWITGFVGGIATILLSPWISRLTFGSGDYAWQIAALGATVLLANVQAGQTALIQGTRRIRQLATLQLAAAITGTFVSVPLYYWLGLRGLVPALVLIAVINAGMAFYFARQVPVPKTTMRLFETLRSAKGMVRVGAALMWNTLAASAAVYGVNAVITHQIGLQAVGIYSAGFALSGMFVNFVLGAMGSDYYPRLAAASGDDAATSRLVNEQTEVGLLLAVPGLVVTITLAPWIVHLLYSREFLPAVPLLQWLTLGCLGRVVSWPLAYLLVAKSRAGWMVACETTVQIAHVLTVLLAIHFFGLAGAGIAFFAICILHIVLVTAAVRSITGFRWSAGCARQIGVSAAFLLVGWLVANIESAPLSTSLAFPCIAIAGLHSLRGLATRLGTQHALTRALLRLPLIGRFTTAGSR